MRRSRNLIVLCVLITASTLLFAQQPREEPNRPSPAQEPRQAEPRQAEPRPDPRGDERNAPRQDESKAPKQDRREQTREPSNSRDQMRPGSERGQHQRPVGRSGHIPDDRFRSAFGRTHTFAVRPVVVSAGQQGFLYGGYTFVFLDPWPEDWGYSDDCYVDYMDGDYYLYDLLHPGMRVALFVVM